MENAQDLRKKAEDILKKRGITDHSFMEMDLVRLVEELSIYQIEIEHQNNELREAQEKLHRSYERYADLFNTAPIGYLILDKSYRITDLNETACSILNQTRAEVVDVPFVKFIHPEFQNIFYFTFRFSSQSNVPRSCDLKLQIADDRSLFARIIVTPESLPTDGDLRFRLAMIDISLEKELEIKLLAESERTRKSERFKSAFLANMSHEIRNPLTSILGFSSLLVEEEVSAEELRNYAGHIFRSSGNLLELVNNILEISKIESGNMPISVSTFRPEEVIDEVAVLFGHKAGLQQTRIVKRPDPGAAGMTITSDRLKIIQVLNNLMSNALKYARGGMVEIGSRLEPGQVLFYVQDNGAGIPEEDQRHLFERFFQASNTISGKNQGTGLGLHVCKATVELLGGKIWFTSKLGKGSVFSFSLPNLSAGSDEKGVDHSLSATVELTDTGTILIVEDDPIHADYIMLILRQYNIRFLHAMTGSEAIAAVRNNPGLDLILMDIKLPVINGYDVTREIRKFNATIPIIALTVFMLDEDRMKALESGCNDLIPKPFTRQTLLGKISVYLKKD